MNKHIIIGEKNRCLCGVYNGQQITCQQILKAQDAMQNRRKGFTIHAYIDDIKLLNSVFQSIAKEV